MSLHTACLILSKSLQRQPYQPQPCLSFLSDAETLSTRMALFPRPPNPKVRACRPFPHLTPHPTKAQVTPQTQRKKREGFYSQASKDLQTRVFHFKKGKGNTGSLRRGRGLVGWANLPQAPACPLNPLPGPEGWLVTGDRGRKQGKGRGGEEAPPGLPLNTEGDGQADTHS